MLLLLLCVSVVGKRVSLLLLLCACVCVCVCVSLCVCVQCVFPWICAVICCSHRHQQTMDAIAARENPRLIEEGLQWEVTNSSALVLSWTPARPAFEANNPHRRAISKEPLPFDFIHPELQLLHTAQVQAANEQRIRAGQPMLDEQEMTDMQMQRRIQHGQQLAAIAVGSAPLDAAGMVYVPPGEGPPQQQQWMGPPPPQQQSMEGPPQYGQLDAYQPQQPMQQFQQQQQQFAPLQQQLAYPQQGVQLQPLMVAPAASFQHPLQKVGAAAAAGEASCACCS